MGSFVGLLPEPVLGFPLLQIWDVFLHSLDFSAIRGTLTCAVLRVRSFEEAPGQVALGWVLCSCPFWPDLNYWSVVFLSRGRKVTP